MIITTEVVEDNSSDEDPFEGEIINEFEEDDLMLPTEELKEQTFVESEASEAGKVMRSSHASSIMESEPTEPLHTHIDMNTGSSHSPSKKPSEMANSMKTDFWIIELYYIQL